MLLCWLGRTPARGRRSGRGEDGSQPGASTEPGAVSRAKRLDTGQRKGWWEGRGAAPSVGSADAVYDDATGDINAEGTARNIPAFGSSVEPDGCSKA